MVTVLMPELAQAAHPARAAEGRAELAVSAFDERVGRGAAVVDRRRCGCRIARTRARCGWEARGVGDVVVVEAHALLRRCGRCWARCRGDSRSSRGDRGAGSRCRCREFAWSDLATDGMQIATQIKQCSSDICDHPRDICGNHPFTAPLANPAMKSFCRTKNRIVTGRRQQRAGHQHAVGRLVLGQADHARQADRGACTCCALCSTICGQMKLFHADMKLRSVNAPIIG